LKLYTTSTYLIPAASDLKTFK